MSNAQTEDVEEALEWLIEEARRPQGKAPRPPVVVRRRAGVIREEIRDLRERLEEAQKTAEIRREEREEMWEAANSNLREARAARRRVDRLEEAGQNVLDERDEHPHRDLSDSREIEGLRIALDSREDEGEVKIHGNDDYQPGLDYPNPVHADEPEGDERTTKRKEICECGHPKWMHSIGGRTGPRGRCAENVCVCTEYRRDPSPTDEPEGDELWECPVCYTVVSGKGTNDRVFVCPNADCPQTTVSKADTFRYQPTDEPVSREGADDE